MTVINLVNVPFADGTTPTGDEVSEVFYLPANIPVSLEGLNGHLDKTNADPSFTEVTYDQVQENSFHYAGKSNGTANLDYFKNWWEDVDLTVGPEYDPPTVFDPLTVLSRFKSIPGGSVNFYLPYASLVVFSWTVMWGNDSRDSTDGNSPDSRINPGQHSLMTFFVDGTHVPSQFRQAPRSLWAVNEEDLGWVTAPGNTATVIKADLFDNVHLAMIKNRYWHGHHTVALSAGWHSASLRILAGTSIVGKRVPMYNGLGLTNTTIPTGDKYLYDSLRQTRTWARSLRYVALRRNG